MNSFGTPKGIAALLLFCSIANGAILPIDPFVGDLSEGFESFALGVHPKLHIFDDHAVMTETVTNVVLVATEWTGPGGTINAQEDQQFAGSPVGSIFINFDTPVTEFGGYFSSVSDIPGAVFTFRNEAGNIIGMQGADVLAVDWSWHGWTSDEPIKSVDIAGNEPLGGLIPMDAMQINPVPEPASLSLMGLAGAIALRRRR